MTWKLLQLAFPLVFVGIALYLYCTNRALLAGFREQLAVSPKGRRFVVMMSLLSLLVYHFIALCGKADPILLLPSSILTFLLFSERYGECIMLLFHRKRWKYCIFVLILAAFLRPETTPMAVTLLVLLIVSWCYPTALMMKQLSERSDTPDIIEDTIAGLRNEMQNIFPFMGSDSKEIQSDDADVNDMPEQEESSPVTEDNDDVSDASSPSDNLSEKAIRRQKQREIDLDRRHSRAKRRARRAKHGH